MFLFQTLLDLLSCIKPSFISRVSKHVQCRVAMLSDEPKFVVDRRCQCLEVFLGCANFEVGEGALGERISVPSSHLEAFQFYLSLQVEFLQKVKKVLSDCFISPFMNLIAGCLRQKDADHSSFVLLDHHSSRISGLLLSYKRNPVLRLIPKWLLEGQEEFVDHSISDFLQCFNMSHRQRWIKFHQSSVQPSERQTRDDLPRMVDIIALRVYFHDFLRIVDLCHYFAESYLWPIGIIKLLNDLSICTFRHENIISNIFLFFDIILRRKLIEFCSQGNRHKSLPPFQNIQDFLVSLKLCIKLLRSFCDRSVFSVLHDLSDYFFEFFKNIICFFWQLLTDLSLSLVEILLWGLIKRHSFQVDLFCQLCNLVIFMREVDEVGSKMQWHSIELLGQHSTADPAPCLKYNVLNAQLGKTERCCDAGDASADNDGIIYLLHL